jgi:hypothetical protein
LGSLRRTSEFLKKATLFLVDVLESMAMRFLEALRKREVSLWRVFVRENESKFVVFYEVGFDLVMGGEEF